MRHGIFHQCLQGNARYQLLCRLRCNIKVADDAVTIAQAFQFQKFLCVGDFIRHRHQAVLLLLALVQNIRQQDDGLTGSAVVVPRLADGKPVDDLQDVVDEVRRHLLLQRL